MVRTGLLQLGLAALLVFGATPQLLAQEGTAPAQPAPAPAPSDGTGTPPEGQADPTIPPAENTTPADATPPADAAQPQTQPADAAPGATTTVPLVPSTAAPAALPQAGELRGSLTQRLFMDAVTGVAGAAVILVLGWAVAVPLALLPWALPQSVSNANAFGVPVSMLITASAVGIVLLTSMAASAAIQRVVRPLLGPEPSFLGPVLGALFFGGVGGAIGLVGSYLLITSPPEPMRALRDNVVGDISNANGRALALTGAITVALAVPMAALGAGIGGPVSAEVEDSRAADAAAGAAGTTVSGGPVRN